MVPTCVFAPPMTQRCRRRVCLPLQNVLKRWRRVFFCTTPRAKWGRGKKSNLCLRAHEHRGGRFHLPSPSFWRSREFPVASNDLPCWAWRLETAATILLREPFSYVGRAARGIEPQRREGLYVLKSRVWKASQPMTKTVAFRPPRKAKDSNTFGQSILYSIKNSHALMRQVMKYSA